MNTQLSKFNRPIISLDQIRRAAPSVFAEKPSSHVSEKYTFIPTTQVISALEREGWQPTYAAQSNAKTPDGWMYAKHVLRFRHASQNNKAIQMTDSIVEVVLTNSHNGASAFVFNAGLFRPICANGLMAASGSIFDARVRHTGYQDEKCIVAAYRLLDEVPAITHKVEEFKSIQLNTEERVAFASAALTAKYGSTEDAPVAPTRLLAPRRHADMANDLWTTLNVVQENALRGGLRGKLSPTGRRTSTRAVTSVSEDIRINKALWQLAEQMRDLKTA
jgi:hypothetical protein